MNVFYGIEQEIQYSRTAVCVGSFDGVHRGHRLVIAALNSRADELGVEPVVVTFDPHPRQLLRGDNQLLTTLEEKLLLMEEAGVRNVVVVKFDLPFSQMTADDFAKNVLHDKLHAVVLFSGDGHHFGRGRQGDQTANVFSKLGIEVCNLPRYENISSTAVRQAIKANNLDQAAHLLGAPYLIIEPITEPTKLIPQGGRTVPKYIRILNKQK